ncbi:heparinase II/III family protein [Bacteroidota bacterium]
MKTSLFYLVLISAFIIAVINELSAQDNYERNLLTNKYDQGFLQSNLMDIEKWSPYPAFNERDKWASLPEEVKSVIIKAGEAILEYDWPALTAELYMQFSRNGNRSNFQAVYFERRSKLEDLILAELVEGKGRFMDQIINGIWAITEETSWCIPAHIGEQKDGYTPLPAYDEEIVDLFAAETGCLMSWTYYLLGDELDKVTPLISKRIKDEVQKRILNAVMERKDFWWMGYTGRDLNNWTPWIVSNWLVCALVIEKDPVKRAASVYKAISITDKFLNPYPADGGCDEGPGYWGHAGGSLFDCLELLYGATGGKINIYADPLIRNMGTYIYKAYIADDYYLNFADAAARMIPDADLIYRYGLRIKDKNMQGFAGFLMKDCGFERIYSTRWIGRKLNHVFGYAVVKSVDPVEPLIHDFWLPNLQVMGARSKEGTREGIYLAAKGGHNAESHNHNDVGNYVIYMDGKPVIMDIGVEEYTQKTFSSQRYTIWTMQSGYHTLPTINGQMQKDGKSFHADRVSFRGTKGSASFAMDIAGAYPEEAGVKKWFRSIFFRRGRFIRIIEDYELEEVNGETYFSYVTPCKVNNKGGEVIFDGGDYKVALEFDANKLEPTIEEIEVKDQRLISSWGKTLRRVKLVLIEPVQADQITFTFKEVK